jgi:hypothetical protein
MRIDQNNVTGACLYSGYGFDGHRVRGFVRRRANQCRDCECTESLPHLGSFSQFIDLILLRLALHRWRTRIFDPRWRRFRTVERLPTFTYRPHPRRGDSLMRSGMDHSDSCATVGKIVQTAVRPRRTSLAHYISDSAPVILWFCRALPVSPVRVGGAPITQNNMFA